MSKTFTQVEISGKKERVCRLFKNGRCAVGQTPDGRYVVYEIKTKEYHVFQSEDGADLNLFLIDNGLVGSILYQGERRGHELRLMELPSKWFVLKFNGQIEYYNDNDEDRAELRE